MKKKMLFTMLALATAMTMSLAGCGNEAPVEANTKEEVSTEVENEEEAKEDESTDETDADVETQDDQTVEVTEEPPVEVEDPEAYLSDSAFLESLPLNRYALVLVDADGKLVAGFNPLGRLHEMELFSDKIADRLVFGDNDATDFGKDAATIVVENYDASEFDALKNGTSNYTLLADGYNTCLHYTKYHPDENGKSDEFFEYGIVTTTTDETEIAKYKEITGIDYDVVVIKFYMYADCTGVYGWDEYNAMDESGVCDVPVSFDFDVTNQAYTMTVLVPATNGDSAEASVSYIIDHYAW